MVEGKYCSLYCVSSRYSISHSFHSVQRSADETRQHHSDICYDISGFTSPSSLSPVLVQIVTKFPQASIGSNTVLDFLTFNILESATNLHNYRFGTVATLLELVPFASILFSFTNTGKPLLHTHFTSKLTKIVGTALWAADIEARDTTMTEVQGSAGEEIKKVA